MLENSKVAPAECGFHGKPLPTFPLDSTMLHRLACQMKTLLMPWLYWNNMLKGRERLTRMKAV